MPCDRLSRMTILPAKMNRLIGRAFADYDMISDGDRILIAVSGGIDSLVLSWLLPFWQLKAPISFWLQAAAQFQCNRIAFGHHSEDLLETFFLNLCYSGNISTMLPRQDLFEGKLSIIRPMVYLEKSQIIDLGQRLGIRPVRNPCRFSEQNKRHKIRQTLPVFYSMAPSVKANMFAALANVRTDYLPKPVRK
ncbi:MAG: ATP-binding protein [Deltaproteobacteria bacterium]